MQYLAIAFVIIIWVVVILLLIKQIIRTRRPAPSASSEQQDTAMCDDTTSAAFGSQYVCPKCGAKTDYPGEDTLIDTLPDCRRELAAIKSMTNLGLALDESACCRLCAPEPTGPALALVITYPDKSTQTIRPITFEDLIRLHEFLPGNLSAEALAKRSEVLAEAVPRLQEAVQAERTRTAIRSMSREQIESMLQTIATSEAPKRELKCAMCYRVASPPDTVEYVCPTCGEKTLYGKVPKTRRGKSPPDDARRKSRKAVQLVDCELPACRREITPIRAHGELDVQVDESALCAKCSPVAKKPQLALVITYSDGSKHRTVPVTACDIQMLRAFLRGDLAVETFDENLIALKGQLPRLCKLLGVGEGPSNPKAEPPQS